MKSFLLDTVPAEMTDIWKLILSSQHHDVYWIETTDLKRTALGWLRSATAQSKSIISESIELLIGPEAAADTDRLILVNPLPFKASSVNQVAVAGIDVEIPAAQLLPYTTEEGASVFLVETEIRGFSAVVVPSGTDGVDGKKKDSRPVAGRDPSMIRTDFAEITLGPGGTILRITDVESNIELVTGNEHLGNEITGRLADETWISNRSNLEPVSISVGPIASLVVSRGTLGPVGYVSHMVVPHRARRIEFRLELDFGSQGVSIGDFWDDTTKLAVYWPIGSPESIVYDIPFGVTDAVAERPLYCTSFIDVCYRGCGIAYFNRGTAKHWTAPGYIANVLAWGGNQFSNRHAGLWEHVAKFDLSLYGKHVIEYALYVHSGDHRVGDVSREGKRYSVPPESVRRRCDATMVERFKSVELVQENLNCSAAWATDRGLVFRVFDTFGRTTSVQDIRKSAGFEFCELESLSGASLSAIGEYQIAVLRIPK